MGNTLPQVYVTTPVATSRVETDDNDGVVRENLENECLKSSCAARSINYCSVVRCCEHSDGHSWIAYCNELNTQLLVVYFLIGGVITFLAWQSMNRWLVTSGHEPMGQLI